VPQPLDEKLSIWIEHNLDDGCVIQRYTELIAECFLKFADKPGVRTKLVHRFLLTLPGC
jgi:hypothetical protein